ncbi:MAG: DUF2306 domain-containing protein [Jatrophihabitantaceae bacterium]
MTPEITTADQAGSPPVTVTKTERPLSQDAIVKRGRPDSWLTWAGIAVVLGAVAWFLYYKLPSFRGLDESRVGIILDKGFSLHYPVLVAHVASGTIALVTLCVQIVPWVRRHHPKVHRLSGRLYVFAGVLPSALLALVLNMHTAFFGGNIGIALMSVLWLGTTAMGYLNARRRRWAQHRRWMTYSFAIALGFVWGSIAGALWLEASEGGMKPVFDVNYLFEFVRWGGWIINLIIAQWWLERTGWKPAPKAERRSAAVS